MRLLLALAGVIAVAVTQESMSEEDDLMMADLCGDGEWARNIAAMHGNPACRCRHFVLRRRNFNCAVPLQYSLSRNAPCTIHERALHSRAVTIVVRRAVSPMTHFFSEMAPIAAQGP